jgi:hypothetical protein
MSVYIITMGGLGILGFGIAWSIGILGGDFVFFIYTLYQRLWADGVGLEGPGSSNSIVRDLTSFLLLYNAGMDQDLGCLAGLG